MESSSKNYIIFGAGKYGKIAYEYLKDQVKIVAFSDDNQNLWETVCVGGGNMHPAFGY